MGDLFIPVEGTVGPFTHTQKFNGQQVACGVVKCRSSPRNEYQEPLK
jgi:hypothetical protein